MGSAVSSIEGVKLSVSLPEDMVGFVDEYAAKVGLSSRSAVIQKAVRELRSLDLQDAYEAAWKEWFASEDAELWERTVGDGIESTGADGAAW